jgi:hypothetical protein
MVFEEIMDRIIKARADVLHASRLLAQRDSRARRGLDPNEYSLLVSLIRQANEELDSVISGLVKESTKSTDAQDPISPRLGRRPTANRSRPS